MSRYRSIAWRRKSRRLGYLAGILALILPAVAEAATVANPLCPRESVSFNPGNGEDIVVPPGFRVSFCASGLNFPAGIAFLAKGESKEFEVFVLESGQGLPSRCNEQDSFGSGMFDPANPFTPDILVFNQAGTKIRGPLGKPSAVGGFPPASPVVVIGIGHVFTSITLASHIPFFGWKKNSVDRFVIVSIFIPKLRLILILNSFLGSSDSLVFSELFHSLAPRPLAARSISDFLLTYLAT